MEKDIREAVEELSRLRKEREELLKKLEANNDACEQLEETIHDALDEMFPEAE